MRRTWKHRPRRCERWWRRLPNLSLERTQIKIQAPAAGWEIGYPSAVTIDAAGDIYVLQRGEKADPLLVLNRDGKILRSWGKGMYKIPHSIRIDPQGNIWTVDSGSSMILKFTPQGEKLMEISVGEQPAGRGATNGTSDIAFGPNGRIFISDGYGNARVLEYTAKGERVRQWGRPWNRSRTVPAAARDCRRRAGSHLRRRPEQCAAAAIRSRRKISGRVGRSRQGDHRRLPRWGAVDRHPVPQRTE